jgi:hypothetical protein
MRARLSVQEEAAEITFCEFVGFGEFPRSVEEAVPACGSVIADALYLCGLEKKDKSYALAAFSFCS